MNGEDMSPQGPNQLPPQGQQTGEQPPLEATGIPGQHIEVTADESQPPSDNLVPTDGTIPDTVIQDHDKAESVAYAGKWQREQAADNRASAERERNAPPRKKYPGYEPVGPAFYDHDYEASAERYDNAADKIEDWAAILHDHPVSEDYKQTHIGVDFSPVGLSRSEDQIQKELDKAEKLESMVNQFPLVSGVVGVENSDVRHTIPYAVRGPLSVKAVMEYAYPKAPDGIERQEAAGVTIDASETDAKWRELDDLMKNPETTLKELRAFYQEAFRVAFVHPVANYANMAKSVLEDVKSGRASQTPVAV